MYQILFIAAICEAVALLLLTAFCVISYRGSKRKERQGDMDDYDHEEYETAS